ncbi:MAG: substrate-binding domain-containing protein [Armatimonadetes bacterium]|nr:substrate-binding domain-containing protein [Armatimonadota bacterium]
MRGLIVAFLAVLMLGGCAPKPPADSAPPAGAKPEPAKAKSEAPSPGTKLRFAVVPKQKDNPVFAYAKTAAERRAKELGVDLVWDAPNANDEAKQAEIVSTLADQGVNGIALSCSNPATLKNAIDKAEAKGIPVICWDSDAPTSKRRAFYGIDDQATGKLLGEEMARLLPSGGSVMILSGVQGAQNLESRIKGVNEALAAAKGIKVLGVQYCKDDVTTSVQMIGDVMSKHPDLGGWVMVGGWPLFAKNGLDAIKPGKTKVVAVDPLPEAQKWLESGHVQVCVGQKVFGWGSESISILNALAQGKPVPGMDAKGFVDSGVDIVVPKKEGAYTDAKYIDLPTYRQQFEAAAGGKS